MKRTATLAITILFFASALFAQSIRGPETAAPGSLVVLAPQDTQDARTFWNLNAPESFDQFAIENGKLFLAMPQARVSFSLFVIPNDVGQPIRQFRHVIEPKGQQAPPDNPGTGDPGTPAPSTFVEGIKAEVAKLPATAKLKAIEIAANVAQARMAWKNGTYKRGNFIDSLNAMTVGLANMNQITCGDYSVSVTWKPVWAYVAAGMTAEFQRAGESMDVPAWLDQVEAGLK